MQIKAIKDWKFVLALALLGLYFLFFSTLYVEEVKLPSTNWSRGLKLAEVSETNIAYSVSSQAVVSIPILEDNTFMTLWSEGTNIKYVKLDKDGECVLEGNIDLNISNPMALQGKVEGDIIHLFSLEDKKLNSYAFNWKKGEVLYKGVIDKGIKGIVDGGDLLFYYDENAIKTLNPINRVTTVLKGEIERLEVVRDNNQEIYHMVYTEKIDNGTQELKYATYSPLDNKFMVHKMAELADTTYVGLSHMDIGMTTTDIYVLITFTDTRFGESKVDCYGFPKDNPEKISIYNLTLQGYAPNPRIIKNHENQLTFIATSEVKTGRNTKTDELICYTLDKGEILNKKLLTSTGGLSIQPQFFTLDGESYLQWVDIRGKNKEIYIASDNKNIIDLANKIQVSTWVKLCMDTLLGLVPISYIAIIPFVYMVLPVVFILLMGSIFFLSRMEREPKKILAFAIALHMLTKLSFTRSTMMNNQDFFQILPVFLKNPVIFTILIIATSIVSIYCGVNYAFKKGNSHFFSAYMRFAVIDVIIYGFLVLPYYYTFIVLPYFKDVG